MAPVMTHIALHVRDLDACVAFYRGFCGLEIVRERRPRDGGKPIYWLAEPGRENDFIFVLLPGGPGRHQADGDFSHFGFALDSRQAVDGIAARAEAAGSTPFCSSSETRMQASSSTASTPDPTLALPVNASPGRPSGKKPIVTA